MIDNFYSSKVIAISANLSKPTEVDIVANWRFSTLTRGPKVRQLQLHFNVVGLLVKISLDTVAYRGVNSCVRRCSGEVREVSAAGAIFLQGVWGPHRPPAGPGQSPGRRFRGAKPPDRKRF